MTPVFSIGGNIFEIQDHLNRIYLRQEKSTVFLGHNFLKSHFWNSPKNSTLSGFLKKPNQKFGSN